MNEGLPNYAPKPTSQEEQEKPVKSTASVEVVETTTQLEAQEKQVEAPQKHDKAPSAEDFRKDFDRLKQPKSTAALGRQLMTVELNYLKALKVNRISYRKLVPNLG
jgi:predicted ATP-binding protein involved in virulence